MRLKLRARTTRRNTIQKHRWCHRSFFLTIATPIVAPHKPIIAPPIRVNTFAITVCLSHRGRRICAHDGRRRWMGERAATRWDKERVRRTQRGRVYLVWLRESSASWLWAFLVCCVCCLRKNIFRFNIPICEMNFIILCVNALICFSWTSKLTI